MTQVELADDAPRGPGLTLARGGAPRLDAPPPGPVAQLCAPEPSEERPDA